MKKRNLIFLAAAVLIIASIVIVLLLTAKQKIDTTFYNSDIKFSSINYDVDIFSDPIYTKKSRDILFLEYGDGETIDKDNISQYNKYAAFFLKYFDIVINGEYTGYKELFTKRFYQYYSLPEKFTMQKIYDITVNLYNYSTVNYNDESLQAAIFTVSYRIMNNNGTFRGDIASDTIRPLVFTLIEQNGSVLINSISLINEK